MSKYSKKIDDIIDSGLKFVNENPRIIKEIYKEISYNDEPKLYRYGVYFKDRYDHGNSADSVAAGVSFDKKRALLKVLGETIERYSLSTNNNKKFVYASFNELTRLNRSALNPKNLIKFSDKKRSAFDLGRKRFHWVEGKCLISNKKILIPAQLVYVPYVYQNSESIIRFPISTGAAADVSIDTAIYRGICEIIERDSFIIHYLNKLNSPQIDLGSINNLGIRNILDILKRYKLQLHLFDITTDLKIPAFAAIIVDTTGKGPAISVGLKSGFETYDVIIGAVEEALMARSWIRDTFIYKNHNYKEEKEITTIEGRAHFWYPLSTIKHLNFWINGKNLKKINIKDLNYSDSKLEKAVHLLREKKTEIIYVDITDEEIKKYGFMVVKVIIPQLHPLYLDEKHPYLGGERLYNEPVRMGIFNSPKRENQLNKIPHPFL